MGLGFFTGERFGLIPYHGLPITPDRAAVVVMDRGHLFVSRKRAEQMALVLELCQSYAIDNAAFSAWREGNPITDWSEFYSFAENCRRTPSCDFAVIPDVIDGSEADNDSLVREWPLPRSFGAPVWHLHESLDRLARLAADFPRVCLGSSGEFSKVMSPAWVQRMNLAMFVVCDAQGRPLVKLHGLRMLDPRVVRSFPLASADSTNIGRNINIDVRWTGAYQPASKPGRAALLRDRIESVNSPSRWAP